MLGLFQKTDNIICILPKIYPDIQIIQIMTTLILFIYFPKYLLSKSDSLEFGGE